MVIIGGTKRRGRLVLLTVLGGFAFSGAARAQSVIAPTPSAISGTPPAIEALGPGEMQVFPPTSALANTLDEVQPLQWGPVTVRPHANYQFIYGTGLRFSTNQPPADTVVQTFSPGVLFVLGPHWTLDYTPSFTFYSDKNFKDTVGQAVSLVGGTVYEDWVLGFSQNFIYSNNSDVQTGTQTEQKSFGTRLSASHALNSKVSVDLSVDQTLSFPTGYQSAKAWSTMDWINYEFWPRLVVGVGAGAGYTVATPDTIDEQLQGRVNWRATDKISLGISAGAQSTQFRGTGANPNIDPIFNGSIQYQPFEHTQLSLGASRNIGTSYYSNQITENTSVSAGLSQRLLQRYSLSVGTSYNWTSYVGAADGTDVNQPIDNYSFTVSLGTSIFKRGSISVFYTYSQAITDQVGEAYVSNQVGFNLGYAF